MYLITGGADGMVHAFSLMDLVQHQNDANSTTPPVRTWSVHQLAVTSLANLDGGRFVSASEDAQIVVMELFSDEKTLAVIRMPHSIQSVVHHQGRLYAGSSKGTIYTVDLNVYAMYQTSQLGVTVKRRGRVDNDTTVENRVFDLDDSEDCYKAELQGHETSVLSLAIMQGDDLLVSGDQSGVVRIWDLESRGCIRVIRPWSHSANRTLNDNNSKDTTKRTSHPVTRILVVVRNDDESGAGADRMFGEGSKQKMDTLVSLVTPLKRFMGDQSPLSNVPVPFLTPAQDSKSSDFWDVRSSSSLFGPTKHETLTKSPTTSSPPVDDQSDEIARLKRELEEAKSTISLLEDAKAGSTTRSSKKAKKKPS